MQQNPPQGASERKQTDFSNSFRFPGCFSFLRFLGGGGAQGKQSLGSADKTRLKGEIGGPMLRANRPIASPTPRTAVARSSGSGWKGRDGQREEMQESLRVVLVRLTWLQQPSPRMIASVNVTQTSTKGKERNVSPHLNCVASPHK